MMKTLTELRFHYLIILLKQKQYQKNYKKGKAEKKSYKKALNLLS